MKRGVNMGKRFTRMFIILLIVAALFWFFFMRSRRKGLAPTEQANQLLNGTSKTKESSKKH